MFALTHVSRSHLVNTEHGNSRLRRRGRFQLFEMSFHSNMLSSTYLGYQMESLRGR